MLPWLQENSRLEQELNEAAEKLIDFEKTITKQQRDLDGFQELEERVRRTITGLIPRFINK